VAAQVCTGGIDWDGGVLLSKKKSLCSHILSMKSTFHIFFFYPPYSLAECPRLLGQVPMNSARLGRQPDGRRFWNLPFLDRFCFVGLHTMGFQTRREKK
jgi:hypothetical protein